jgi:hypothetical protein
MSSHDEGSRNLQPILGQEAIVPKYGLGRVTSLNFTMPNIYVGVTPYVAGHELKFAPENVTLVPIWRD